MPPRRGLLTRPAPSCTATRGMSAPRGRGGSAGPSPCGGAWRPNLRIRYVMYRDRNSTSRQDRRRDRSGNGNSTDRRTSTSPRGIREAQSRPSPVRERVPPEPEALEQSPGAGLSGWGDANWNPWSPPTRSESTSILELCGEKNKPRRVRLAPRQHLGRFSTGGIQAYCPIPPGGGGGGGGGGTLESLTLTTPALSQLQSTGWPAVNGIWQSCTAGFTLMSK